MSSDQSPAKTRMSQELATASSACTAAHPTGLVLSPVRETNLTSRNGANGAFRVQVAIVAQSATAVLILADRLDVCTCVLATLGSSHDGCSCISIEKRLKRSWQPLALAALLFANLGMLTISLNFPHCTVVVM